MKHLSNLPQLAEMCFEAFLISMLTSCARLQVGMSTETNGMSVSIVLVKLL